MITTLKQLFSLTEFKSIPLVAGEGGIRRPVTGVNTIESDRLVEFIKANELIITTGINMHQDQRKLIAMVQTAFKSQAAGIVINVGPYTPSIPEQVLQFANENQFPVFEMPWVYRIADFVKITVQYLATLDPGQGPFENILSQILFQSSFSSDEMKNALAVMGISPNREFNIVLCVFNEQAANLPWTKYTVEEELSKEYKIHLSMTYKNQWIYLVGFSEIHTSEQTLSGLIDNIYKQIKGESKKVHLLIGAGSYHRIQNLKKSYQEALKVIQIARKRPELKINEYKHMGAYKLIKDIMDISDTHLIIAFHEESLGGLYRYDQLHHTKYIDFLRVFLAEDGHTTNIANKEFIHRNTVLYKIKKIESILAIDLNHPFIKTNLTLAFMMEDMLH
ncbi:MAG: PucR family transcriptional regulator [Sporolactobacillus sp.]